MTTPAEREAARLERELREALAARAELVAAALAVADAYKEQGITWPALDRLKAAASAWRATVTR